MNILEERSTPDGLLRLIVRRDDGGEVEVGFDGFPWRVRGAVLAENFGLPADEAIRLFVSEITEDERVLAMARSAGVLSRVWPTENASGEFAHKGEDEALEFRLWSGPIA